MVEILTIPRLIYSRITQVLVIVEWFCGQFCSKIFENSVFQVSGFVYMKWFKLMRIGLVDHVFII